MYRTLVILISLAGLTASQTIPTERIYLNSWQHAGISGHSPPPDTILNVQDYGATGDGSTSDSAAVQNAIASLSGAPGVIYFPAGTYRLTSGISLPSGTVLRGQRSELSTLLFDVSGHCITAAGTAGTFQPLISGHTNHSSAVTVTDGTGFTPGGYAHIRQESDPAWGTSVGWGDYAAGQIIKITAVSNNTLTLETELRMNFPAAQNPEIRPMSPVTNVGIENLTVERLPNGSPENRYTLYFLRAANCQVRGVEGYNGFGGHICLQESIHIEITGSYLHHAVSYGGGGCGYGIRLESHTSECLVENNIFKTLRHAMLMQVGPNGNVFGYNYSRDVNRDEPFSDYGGDICGHGNYPFANLFEGNICQNLHFDSTHGANGPHNTAFRNRLENYGIIINDSPSYGQNIIGNEVTSKSSWLFDTYDLSSADHFEYGNNTADSGITPSQTDSLPDYSYYLGSDPMSPPPTPAFWTLENAIPTLGPPNSRGSGTIPAKARYAAGTHITVGPPSLAVQPADQSVDQNQPATFSVEAFGTPAAEFVWQKDSVALPAETNAALSIPAAQEPDEGDYRVIISDAHGTVTSAVARLIVESISGRNVPETWYRSHGLTNGSPDILDLLDSDNDGVLNWQEYTADTNPTNPASLLKITAIDSAAEPLVIAWQGGESATQYLETATALTPPDWTCIHTNPPPTAVSNSFPCAAVTNSTRFYRIKTER